MEIPEFNKRFGKVIQQTQSFDNGETMVKVGISAFTFIYQRVHNEGIDAKGKKYKSPVPGSTTYSTKDMLVGCKSFRAKDCKLIFGSKKKRSELDWRMVGVGTEAMRPLAILKGGYKKWREIRGAQTDHVDFAVTNNMWNDINVKKDGSGLVSKKGDHMRGTAIIGAKQEQEKKKLAGNTKRFGDILDLNANEIEDLKLTYKIQELQIFKENGIA